MRLLVIAFTIGLSVAVNEAGWLSRHSITFHLRHTQLVLCAGKLQVNSPKRAAQVRKAIEWLGPAYVKVAQAISTRGDILDVNYLREIERLQDRVPPFPTKAALLVMAEGGHHPARLLHA